MFTDHGTMAAFTAAALIIGGLLWLGWHRGSVAKEQLRGKQAAQRARYAQHGRGQIEVEPEALTRTKPNFGRR